MGVEPPFLYDPPSRYSFSGPTDKPFNPKAATHASWSPPAHKAKPDGPLINFNKHPDSYLVAPYGNLNVEPMSPNTKSKVKYSRQVQLGLRILELLGALGLLFCVIAIKGTSGSLGWIIRVAPGVALLHTIYAVYHLCRSPIGRTPASSASYMLFAAMIDAGLLPFLAFSAVMAHSEHTKGTYGWDTLFGEPVTTWYIVYSTFLLCVTEGGLLLISLILGIYLAILFRKIAKLPPDMNPLEPNLTMRPHKRNKSELNTSEKRMSQTTLASNNRMSSTADPLLAPGRRVPFMHTRTDSADSVTVYGNNSPRNSRLDLSKPGNLYRQANNSFRNSYTALNKSLPNSPSRPQSATAPSTTYRQTAPNHDSHRQLTASSHLVQPEPTTWHTLDLNDGRVSPLPETYHHLTTTTGGRYYQQHSNSIIINDENIHPPPSEISPISSRASTPDPVRNHHGGEGSEYMEIINWYEPPHVRNKRSRDRDYYAPIHQQQPGAKQDRGRRGSLYDFERDLRSPSPEVSPQTKMMDGHLGKRNPLGMNPPTPSPSLPEQQQAQHTYARRNSFEAGDEKSLQAPTQHTTETKRHALHDAPINIPSNSTSTQRPKMGTRPSSFVGSGSKGRYYGDLRGSVVGKRNSWGSDSASDYSKGSISASSGTVGSSEEGSWEGRGGGVKTRTSTMKSDGTGNVEILGSDSDDEDEYYHRQQHQLELERKSEREEPKDREPIREEYQAHDADRKGRVISNTGRDHDHDLAGGYAGLGAEFGKGMGRRKREVSGKVVEEGRGKNFGAVVANGVEGGEGGLKAAGWARFKGL